MRKRSFSLTEAVKNAKKRRNIWSSEYQNSDVPVEEKANEPSISEDFTDGKEIVATNQPGENGSISVLTEKPRVAKPIRKPDSAQKLKPVLRPKSTPSPTQQAAEPVAERSPLCHTTNADRPEPSTKPLERKSPPFGDRYERITTYLEKPLFRRVHDLHQCGEFAKIANLLNATVREYLDRHYPA